MNISVSDEMHRMILHSVRTGGHSSVSEYIRSLVRRDQPESSPRPPAPLSVSRPMNDIFRNWQDDDQPIS